MDALFDVLERRVHFFIAQKEFSFFAS